jgi:RHS repeat-associated protein
MSSRTTSFETMTWDEESRMLSNSLANASYAYNGFDARVSKTVGANTTTFKRAGADPVSPVLSDVVGATTTRYLPGISSNVGGTSTFMHSGIKNGILQTNSLQSNTATKRYDAFGNDLATTGTWQTRFDYGGAFGYQKDTESDYKLLGHRYYDPEIGRFLTRDPIKDGRNWYAYCSNKSVTGFDPSGLFEWSRYWEDVGDMFRGYGDALWEMSTPNMILNSPKLIQAMWEDPVGTAGKVGSGLMQSFTDFSTTDMRATGRTTMNWIMALAPVGLKGAGGKGITGKINGGLRLEDATVVQARSLPKTAEPSSVLARVDLNGKLKQVRVYDDRGNPAVDIDWGHPHHGAGDPHYHPWPGGKRHEGGIPFRQE